MSKALETKNEAKQESIKETVTDNSAMMKEIRASLKEELLKELRQELNKEEELTKKIVVPKEKDRKDRLARKLAIEKEKEQKMVRGIFRNLEIKGAGLKFAFKKYPGEPVVTYDLKDETIYDLPLSVVKHLNNDCWYPEHGHSVDEEGRPKVKLTRKIRRFSFSPTDFMDESEFSSGNADIIIATPL